MCLYTTEILQILDGVCSASCIHLSQCYLLDEYNNVTVKKFRVIFTGHDGIPIMSAGLLVRVFFCCVTEFGLLIQNGLIY